jgi:hypothetical protein
MICGCEGSQYRPDNSRAHVKQCAVAFTKAFLAREVAVEHAIAQGKYPGVSQ